MPLGKTSTPESEGSFEPIVVTAVGKVSRIPTYADGSGSAWFVDEQEALSDLPNLHFNRKWM